MYKKCYNCKYYSPLYLKVYCGFINSDCGYCIVFQSAKSKNDCCKNWIKQIPEVFDSSKFKKTLEGALTRLSGITIILNELTEQLNGDKE